MIRRTDPPDSRSNVSTSDPGPSVSVSEHSSGDKPQPRTDDTQESMTVSGPGPSTSGVSIPGPSYQDIHKYNSGKHFNYFVGTDNVSESEDEDNNDADNSVNVDVVHDVTERDDFDIESEDDIDVSDNDAANDDKEKKKKRQSKWEKRQDLKWENLTKKCLFEAAKTDMANGVYKTKSKCAEYYDLNERTLGKLIRENREYVGDG